VDALDAEIKNTFGAEYSYELLRNTHRRIAKVDVERIDNAQYLTISFERSNAS
jgi:hypothetical protein